MERLLVLKLGNGNGQIGWPSVIVQLWLDDGAQPMQLSGSLPAMPDLDRAVQRWQRLYLGLYQHLDWRQAPPSDFEFAIDDADLTHISQTEFTSVCQELVLRLNQWLNTFDALPVSSSTRRRKIDCNYCYS